MIDHEFVPALVLHAMTGLAKLTSDNELFADPLAMSMLVDVLNERGYRTCATVEMREVPVARRPGDARRSSARRSRATGSRSRSRARASGAAPRAPLSAASSPGRWCPRPSARRRHSSTSPARRRSAPASCRATRPPRRSAVRRRSAPKSGPTATLVRELRRQRVGLLRRRAVLEEQRHPRLAGGRRRVRDQDVGLVAARAPPTSPSASAHAVPGRVGAGRVVRLVPRAELAGPPQRPLDDDRHAVQRLDRRRDGDVGERVAVRRRRTAPGRPRCSTASSPAPSACGVNVRPSVSR